MRCLAISLALLFAGCASPQTVTGNSDGRSGRDGGGDPGNPDGGGNPSGNGDGGGTPGGGGGSDDMRRFYDNDAFFAEDPPAAMCTIDGSMLMPPPPPGGTPECPDDKNREGCPCENEGQQVPCWPGLRANRNLGICMDGVTTCTRIGETFLGWGKCQGYVLPQAGASDGAEACKCFSSGTWRIENLSPCFFFDGSNNVIGAVSTFVRNGQAECPDDLVRPSQAWSTDTVKADCAGHFKLCYTLKAGNAANPQAGDCVLAQTCTEADYPTANQVQTFPPLPSWLSNSAQQVACARSFVNNGGYGEMSVRGTTLSCDALDKVFLRITYCRLECNQNPAAPGCDKCGNGASGSF